MTSPRLHTHEQALWFDPGPDTIFLLLTKQQKENISASFRFPEDWKNSFRKEYNQEIFISTESRTKENEW